MITRRLFTAGLVTAPVLISNLMRIGAASAAKSGVLSIAQGFDPVSLWPNFSTTQEQINVGNLIVESLFWIDEEESTTQPILASAYEMLDDKTVCISLRENIKFTNGEPMDVDAVLHSIAVFKDLTVTPAYGRYSSIIDGAEKGEDNQVILKLKHPYPAVELILSQIFILPPKYWNEVGGAEGFGSKPIGTGPFKLGEWIRDSHIVMDSNSEYWGELPKGIEQIVLRPIPDDMIRAQAIIAGEYDIVTNIPTASKAQIDAAGLKTLSVPSYRIFTVSLSNLPGQDTPLKDVKVRQAINYAVNKQGIIDGLFLGEARSLRGQLLRDNQLGFDSGIDDYPYNPTKARELLVEAGFPDGFDITFKFPTGRYAQDREVAEAISGMLAEVGIRAQMVSLEPGEFLRQLSARELHPMGYVGLAPADDPDMQMSQYRSDWRYSYVNNKDLDELIDAGGQELDWKKRDEIYKKASRLFHDEAHVLFLYQAIDLYAISDRVEGFNPRGDQRWVVYGMSLE
ncbi:ABC transporter substrate-binding protein [Paenochrobactrum sp. BZR 588]|uniref:ABC transporter substrate-binding protein n=1 Tax=unclassified Paenochrobactrum TaxID=2639760 RepID=UPI0038554860